MSKEIKQTRDEKTAMYLKLTKRELVELLVNANEALDSIQDRALAALERTK